MYNRKPDDDKVVQESEGIFEAIELETLHGEYKWSQILKTDRVQTGRRVLLDYGMQFMNQRCGINLVVVCSFSSTYSLSLLTLPVLYHLN